MMRFLRDGVRSEADWRVLRRRHVWGLLAGMYQASLDVGFRRQTLQVSLLCLFGSVGGGKVD